MEGIGTVYWDWVGTSERKILEPESVHVWGCELFRTKIE